MNGQYTIMKMSRKKLTTRILLFMVLSLCGHRDETSTVLAFSPPTILRRPPSSSFWRKRQRRQPSHSQQINGRKRRWYYAYNYLDTISSSAATTDTTTTSQPNSYLNNTFDRPLHNTKTKERDMNALSVWALDNGVLLAPGIQLSEDSKGDWSVSLTESCTVGTPIITVPDGLILSSDVSNMRTTNKQDDDMQFLCQVREWFDTEQKLSYPNTNSFLPEFFLAFRILYEVYLDNKSRWQPWIQALPSTFSTGLYFDRTELNYIERSSPAKKFLTAQRTQFNIYSTMIEDLIGLDQKNSEGIVNTQRGETKSILPPDFHRWLVTMSDLSNHNDNNTNENLHQPKNQLDELLRWTYTVVFTRCWRTPSGTEATIVPLGDMINHNSQEANLRPYVTSRLSDNALQLCLTEEIVGFDSNNVPTGARSLSTSTPSPVGKEIYLNYGINQSPARFLVVFGFCDFSAKFVDAHLDFLTTGLLTSVDNFESSTPFQLLLASIFDESRLVISTNSGAVTQEVWLAFLYQFLQEDNPDEIKKLEDRFQDCDDDDEVNLLELLDDLLWDNEMNVADKMKCHYQHLLDTEYREVKPPIDQQNLELHSNLEMIIAYNSFMRNAFENAIHFVDEYMKQVKDDIIFGPDLKRQLK